MVRIVIQYRQALYELVADHPLNERCWADLRQALEGVPGMQCRFFRRPSAEPWEEWLPLDPSSASKLPEDPS